MSAVKLIRVDKTFRSGTERVDVIKNLSHGEAIQGEVIKGFPGKGVTPVKFDREILERLNEVTQRVLTEEAEKDADFRRIWESQKRFLETYRAWKDHAYLPRDFQ